MSLRQWLRRRAVARRRAGLVEMTRPWLPLLRSAATFTPADLRAWIEKHSASGPETDGD